MDFKVFTCLGESQKLDYLFFKLNKKPFSLSDLFGLFGLLSVLIANVLLIVTNESVSSLHKSDISSLLWVSKVIITIYSLIFIFRFISYLFTYLEERDWLKSLKE